MTASVSEQLMTGVQLCYQWCGESGTHKKLRNDYGRDVRTEYTTNSSSECVPYATNEDCYNDHHWCLKRFEK